MPSSRFDSARPPGPRRSTRTTKQHPETPADSIGETADNSCPSYHLCFRHTHTHTHTSINQYIHTHYTGSLGMRIKLVASTPHLVTSPHTPKQRLNPARPHREVPMMGENPYKLFQINLSDTYMFCFFLATFTWFYICTCVYIICTYTCPCVYIYIHKQG